MSEKKIVTSSCRSASTCAPSSVCAYRGRSGKGWLSGRQKRSCGPCGRGGRGWGQAQRDTRQKGLLNPSTGVVGPVDQRRLDPLWIQGPCGGCGSGGPRLHRHHRFRCALGYRVPTSPRASPEAERVMALSSAAPNARLVHVEIIDGRPCVGIARGGAGVRGLEPRRHRRRRE